MTKPKDALSLTFFAKDQAKSSTNTSQANTQDQPKEPQIREIETVKSENESKKSSIWCCCMSKSQDVSVKYEPVKSFGGIDIRQRVKLNIEGINGIGYGFLTTAAGVPSGKGNIYVLDLAGEPTAIFSNTDLQSSYRDNSSFKQLCNEVFGKKPTYTALLDWVKEGGSAESSASGVSIKTRRAAGDSTKSQADSALKSLSSGRKYRCFLTHNWGTQKKDGKFDNHERVRRVYNALQKKDIPCWFDSDRMSGTIIEQMSSGIDDSDVVIGNLYIIIIIV